MRCFLPLAAMLAAASLAPALSRAQTIDTRSGATSFTASQVAQWVPVGSPTTQSYNLTSTSQAFVAPAVLLDEFTFFLGAFPGFNSGSLVFEAFIFPWESAFNGPVSGSSPLWSSAPRTGPTQVPPRVNGFFTGDGWVPYTFSTGGLTLTPGQMYGAVLSAVATPGTPSIGEFFLASVELVSPPNHAAGAGSAYGYTQDPGSASANVLSDLSRTVWSDPYAGAYDAAFVASFSTPPATVTPEPASLVGLATGLAMLAARRWRRRSALS